MNKKIMIMLTIIMLVMLLAVSGCTAEMKCKSQKNDCRSECGDGLITGGLCKDGCELQYRMCMNKAEND